MKHFNKPHLSNVDLHHKMQERKGSFLASLYHAYQNKFPHHRGKHKVLSLMRHRLTQSSFPLIWRMKNGLEVAITREDIHAGCGVGWTCFESGVWEKHIEDCLISILKPGDVALDIGANLGYFSATMARKVGNGGSVIAFEPVPNTVEQLQLTKAANRLDNLSIMPFALGAADSSATIRYNPAVSGNASLYNRADFSEHEEVEIIIRSLDSLYKDQQIPKADVIKIDIEGHEINAVLGGKHYITISEPAIIFEYNPETAHLANWDLPDMITLLEECHPFTFFVVHKDGKRTPLDFKSLRILPSDYIDILALHQRFDMSS